MAQTSDSLSPDQFEKVLEFQDVSGCTDVTACVEVLAAAGWNVEAALHEHLTAASESCDAAQAEASEDADGEVRRRQPHSNSTREEITSNATTASRSESIEVSNVSSYNGSATDSNQLSRPGLLRSLPKFACILAPDPARDMAKFISSYEAKYEGLPHPPFYRGSYSQALSVAKQRLQFLLVYLHCSDHVNTGEFCRKVMSHQSFLNFISSNDILFWACDVSLPEGYRVSEALRENDYPYLSLVVLRGSRMSVVARLEGAALLDAEHLVATLAQHHITNMTYITSARNSRLEREQAVALRQEQDSAYEASLKADREKARLRQQLEQREREQHREHQRRQELIERRKTALLDFIPPEPDVDSPETLQLVVKLPHGGRLERKFSKQHKLSGLFCLIYTHEHAPDRFEVTTNFPRRVIPCRPPAEFRDLFVQDTNTEEHEVSSEQLSTVSGVSSDADITFGEAGIESRTVLFVKDLDA